jgi:hypothetical protein
VLPLVLALLLGSFPPRVEDPLPDSIGLSFPLTLAGALSVILSTLNTHVPAEQRDRRARLGGLAGFWIGVAVYVFSLTVQLISN